MAAAEKTTIARVVMEDGFTLKLTVDEAETLVAVLACVGGSPDTSPRGLAEGVLKSLIDVGVRNYWPRLSDHPASLTRGSVQFNDYAAED
ncbi:hypothetical protein ACFW08_05745 [Streptomyces sp. NPDC058960]|uniref:hypothetical protein n=1 Tax=Streptomyces sp. NPDC058960 TaxID=3346679 RepID=UPI0036B8219A